MSKYEIESLIETMNNYDDLASKAKAKADAIRDTLKGDITVHVVLVFIFSFHF